MLLNIYQVPHLFLIPYSTLKYIMTSFNLGRFSLRKWKDRQTLVLAGMRSVILSVPWYYKPNKVTQ